MPQLHERPALRRLTRTVAVGGGGLTLLGVTGVGVLVAEAHLARRWIVRRMSTPHDVDGGYDDAGRVPGPATSSALVACVLGDSAAAGLGAVDASATPGALLATGLADGLGRPVDLHTQTRAGAVSAELAGQVDRLQAESIRPDVALIIVGGNDVTNRVPAAVAARQLGEAVKRLRDGGAVVVVGTVPDLSTITSIGQPLRALAGRWSRQLAAAQTVAIIANGGHPVNLRGLTAGEFHAEPAAMFSSDRFHPSDDGYRRSMAHVVPVVLSLLGQGSTEVSKDGCRGDEGGFGRLGGEQVGDDDAQQVGPTVRRERGHG